MVWPLAFDYPLARKMIEDNRDLFNKVIISFTSNSVERDYRKLLINLHPDFTFIQPEYIKHWYNDALTGAIKGVKSDWVLFLEQDFLYNRKELKKLLRYGKQYEFVALQQGERLHLGCALIKKELIDKTLGYFGDFPRYHLDCFDFFFAELLVLAGDNWASLDKIMAGYKHLNGLTQNLHLSLQGKYDDVTDKKEFKKYLKLCSKIKEKKIVEWDKLMSKILEDINGRYR